MTFTRNWGRKNNFLSVDARGNKREKCAEEDNGGQSNNSESINKRISS